MEAKKKVEKKKVEKKKVEKRESVAHHRQTKRIEKKTVTKEPKQEKKSTQEETFKEKLVRITSSYKFLYSTFGILLLLVIVLFLAVNAKQNEAAKNASNIVFSIMESNTHSSINVGMEGLVNNQYILKVTNNRKGELNKKGTAYTITLINDTDAEIEVLNDDSLENLMTDQKQTTITGKTFSKTEKEETVYYIRVKDGSKVKTGDQLKIEVDS